ncbi:GGDEF domain-containing protein [Actinoplanes teichomyceticus]|uniref:Diguanylate cyclase (GGDEF)-like protein n=1 Tax=Actinoplanes teichomyceticus TaxID=1867 RepID=A0A561WJM1_ACTTI|nr:GGDEF domain-containing protein [Actinoplanes teichomyceticus]TWG24076.1 diguanylate cyclase (GGDEF)-like protein [Actinoplanes teichomyceticus]GIF12116.1 hypothetical protein Ate01nite_21480 [Actinoplanes teichomyceticus]
MRSEQPSGSDTPDHGPWRLWLGLVLVCVVLRVGMSAVHLPYLVTTVPYLVVTVGTPVAVLVGTLRHRPPHRAGWLTLAVGQLLYAVGDVLSIVDEWLSGDFLEPTPADLMYLASYVLVAAAVLIFIRRRAPGWDVPSAVDALIVAISAGLLTWVYLIQPLTADSELPMAAKLTESAYPVLDLMLLILTVRLVMGHGTRGAVLYFLLAGLTTMFTADTLYAVVGVVTGQTTFESWLDGLWMIALGLLGAAALHPGIRHFDRRTDTAIPDASPGRLGVLAVAVLMAPGLQLIQHLRHQDLSVPLATAACAVMFLLVLARMAGLVATQRRAAVTDGLTGVRNRRHFEDALTAECRRAARAGYGLGLLMIDVDHFKKINDTYGHPAGDRVLRELARRLTAGRRAGTMLARYGGEEFVALVPHLDAAELPLVAERVRQSIAELPIEVSDRALITVTASIGAAWSRGPRTEPAGLLRAADEALYAAKAAGRNRTVVAPAAHAPASAHG